MRHGFPLDEIQKITGYDPWFLGEVETIIHVEAEIRKKRLAEGRQGFAPPEKAWAFSDARLAKLTDTKRKHRAGGTACPEGAALLQAYRFPAPPSSQP